MSELGTWQVSHYASLAMRLEAIQHAFDSEHFYQVIIEAEELLDSHPAHLETLRTLSDALIGVRRYEGACLVLSHLLEEDSGQTSLWVELAGAAFNHCDLQVATEAARKAIQLSPELPEGYFYLGLALDQLGQRSLALAAFSAAHALEPDQFPFPLSLNEEDWRELLKGAIASLEPELSQFWSDIPFFFHELPDLTELLSFHPALPPTIVGLVMGEVDQIQAPTGMRLFSKNLEKVGSLEEIEEQIKMTLIIEAESWIDQRSAETVD